MGPSGDVKNLCPEEKSNRNGINLGPSGDVKLSLAVFPNRNGLGPSGDVNPLLRAERVGSSTPCDRKAWGAIAKSLRPDCENAA